MIALLPNADIMLMEFLTIGLFRNNQLSIWSQDLEEEVFPLLNLTAWVSQQSGNFQRKEAPAWRNLNIGLNLQGICINSKCKAFKKKVWIPKHFGKFNIAMEVYKSPCPICNQLCQNVQNMGLYQARCISNGRIKGEKDEKRMQSQQTKKDEFLTFEDKDETRVDWLYLEMEILPL